MKKFGLILACVAGSTVSSVAFADPDTTNLPPVRALTLENITGGDYVRGTFGNRVDLPVYSIGVAVETGGGFAGPGDGGATAYDDVTFGGPGATGDVLINGLAFGVWYPINAPGALFMRVQFWETHNNAAPATSPPFSGASIDYDLNIGGGWGGPGIPAAGGFFADPVTFGGPGDEVTLTNAFIGVDRTVGVKMDLFVDGAFTTRAVGHGLIRRANHGIVPFPSHIVGDSDFFGWFGTAGATDGVILNSAAAPANRSGSAAGERGTFLKLQGTGYNPPAPAMDYNLGCIADGTTTTAVNTNLAGPQPGVAWASICLAGDAFDTAGITGEGQFFDVWAEGTSNVTLGIFDSVSGELIEVDTGDGPDSNGQFSFGIGRRAALGNSLVQRDGRDFFGGPGLANGTYFVAIAPEGSTFSAGWSVTPAVGGGLATLKTETNVNGATLATSVAPIVDLDLDANGTILSPGVQLPPVAREAFEISWYKFTTCQNSSDAFPISVDLGASDLAPAGSTHAVFDSTGDLIASATAADGEAAPLVFDGTNVLVAGVYYIMQSYEGTVFSPVATTDGRWHARGTVGNGGFAFEGTLNVAYEDCAGGGGCDSDITPCRADQDGDEDIDSDDINIFFGNFEAGDSCGDQDDDDDVDSDDINTFFGRFEAGGC